MTSKRLFFGLIGLLILVILGIGGGVYAINSNLEKRSSKLVGLKAKLQSLQQEQVELVQIKKDLAKYAGLYQISQVIVPQNKDQTETVRQIANLAAQNGVTLQSITFPASSLGTGTSPLAIGTGGTSSVPGSTTPTTGSTLIANPNLSQLAPVTHIPGVYDLKIEVASAVDPDHEPTYPQVIGFLSGLEQNRLTAQVSEINLQPSTQSVNKLSFTLNLDSFIKPGSIH